jgi:two-component system OmpR family sensor kinase
MEGKELELPTFDKDMNIALIDVDNNVIYGSIMGDFFPTEAQFFEHGDYSIFISDAPMQHLDIKFVIVQSKALFEEVNDLKQSVSGVIFLVIMIMITLAWILSKLFMRPLHQKIEQIEGFVHDTAHELNTPITALSMSVSRALKKKEYDEKILKNISISTKQLFDIYSALSYISFESKHKEADRVDVSVVLNRSVAYYKELSESKKITIDVEAESFMFVIDETKLSMLFGNLISNAIKYSMPDSKIQISLKEGVFIIMDQGIGIDKDKLSQIFEKYNRQTEYAGGFGIGLSIVQKVCQEYGITIDVKSEKDRGTSFTLRF